MWFSFTDFMNDKPELSKVDDAISKSLKIIEFPYQFVCKPILSEQREIDLSLKHKFDEVRYHQQFMRILLSYHKRFIMGNKPIDDPEHVVNATNEYIEENNPVGLWLNDNYMITNNPEDRVKVDELYTDFYPKPTGFTKKKFGQYMSQLGLKSKISNGSRYYTGLQKKRDDYQ